MNPIIDIPFLTLIGLVAFLALRATARRFTRLRAPNLIGLVGGFGAALLATAVNLPLDRALETKTTARHVAPTTPILLRDVSSLCHRPVGVSRLAAVGHSDSLHLERSATVLEVNGWATDHLTRVSPRGVCIAIDGRIAQNATSTIGGIRPDVASALNDPKALDSGFTIVMPTADLGAGHHSVQVIVISRDGTIATIDSSSLFNR